MAIKLSFFPSHGGTVYLSLFLFYSFFRMPPTLDVLIVITAAALVAIQGGGGSGFASAECSNCERRINEWCCEIGWRGSCCEFPLQGGALAECLHAYGVYRAFLQEMVKN